MAAQKVNVNPDLQYERDNATFDSTQLTYFLYGGAEKTRRKRYIQSLALNEDWVKNGPSWETLSREEKYGQSMQKAIRVTRRIKELGLTDPLEAYYFSSTFMPNEGSPFGLHNSMFTDIINSQASEEQKQKWLPLVQNYLVLGTYAQTELGHGTYIRGLETTATFDSKTQEFVINSPTLTSIKFWPGALGKTTNHCVVMAQLYTQGRCHGLQSFIVPTRDLDTHQPLTGVEVGDIGTKFGYDSIDNGYLRLSNVRIPRDYMLMKHSQVTRDGTFMKPKHGKLLYGAMVKIRTFITGESGRGLSMASTIGIRYSAVRRQTENVSGKGEAKILDYQTQQYKLFPALATSFAFIFAGIDMATMYVRVMSQIERGAVEELPQLHALSAGLKAVSSYNFSEMTEVCRMACGGHGYSQASGFPKLYTNLTPACTYEGENTVLLLQTARHLIKCLTNAKQRQPLPTMCAYLNNPIDGRTSTLKQNLDFASIIEAFEFRAANLINECARRIQGLTGAGKSAEDAWNSTSVMLTKAARAHVECCVVKIYIEHVCKKMEASLVPVLQALCKLYCVYTILENLGEFVKDGYINGHQVEMLNNKLLDLLAEIRPNAVAIVDAFDIPDFVLSSSLGRYDGQVYQALYDFARNSKLNQTEVPEAYYKYLKPFLDEQKQLNTAPAVASRL